MTTSRYTYRRPANEVAWQKQIRDRYMNEGCPVRRLSLKEARVESVGRNLAKAIIDRYEWLGTLGSSSLFYGLMFGHHCAGVCCVAIRGSGTAGPTTGRKFGLDQKHIATLARGACVHWAPSGANSKLVSWTAKRVGGDGIAKIMLAYSDSDAGEVGTIYQACGWTYIGTTQRPSDGEYVSPKGRVLNSQSIGAWARRCSMTYSAYKTELIKRGWRTQKSNPKGIYAVVLDKKDENLLRLLSRLAKPYPKRAESIGSDAPANHAGEGGATPTSALHSDSHT